jgi:ribosomal protein S12 methylthiotransferase
MAKNVHFVSLGCSKNLVDAEVMLGKLNITGYKIEQDPSLAEVIIVNTCSFVGPAKEESIQTILDMADYKNDRCEALVVTGCLSQRYTKELEVEYPEVDHFVGTGEYQKKAELLKGLEEKNLLKNLCRYTFFHSYRT